MAYWLAAFLGAGFLGAGFLGGGAAAQTTPAPLAQATSAPAQAANPPLQSCRGKAGLPSTVKPGVYRGTVAGQAAALHLGESYRYFYEKSGLDIELEVSQQAGQLLMQEGTYDPKSGQQLLRACFQLTATATGLSGTWIRAGEKKGQPVTLTRLDSAKLPLALPATPGLLKLRRDDPYSFLKVNRAWPKVPNGQSVREPLSGVTYLRLPGESAALNGALQDRQVEYALNKLDCQSLRVPLETKTEFTARQIQWYRTPKLVSFVETVSYYCGGAHPNYYELGVILDRLTGEEVRLDELWADFHAPQQHQLYLAALPATLGAECREVLKERQAPSYTVSLNRLAVRLWPTDLPHVVLACAEAVTVPYSKLKAFTYPGLRYYHEFYK